MISGKNGFSAQSLFPEKFLTLYNMMFTAFPCVLRAITDYDLYPINQADGETLR
jgi:hypothetical protein